MKKILVSILLLNLFNIGFASAADYECRGTEPFWMVSVNANNLQYANSEMKQTSDQLITNRRDALGTKTGTVSIITTAESTLTLISGRECTDGMSELTYTHHAVYDFGGHVYYGCCALK